MALLPNRNVLDGSKIPATTTSEMKTALGSLRDYLAGLLGTDSADLAAARAALGVGAASRVQGLVGAVNVATPLTKYDLAADAVVLRNAAGGTVARYATGAITNDLGLAGVTANGRDQAAVFPISNFVYLYFIWDGTTLATISSLAAPSVGPALPTGYTHWAFATVVRWNASSNILPSAARGSIVELDALVSLVAAGQATTLTSLSAAAVVPSIALTAKLRTGLLVTSHTSVAQFDLSLRRTGLSGTGLTKHSLVTPAASVPALSAYDIFEIALGGSQQIDYRINAVPAGGGGAYVDVLGYRVPNGDS